VAFEATHSLWWLLVAHTSVNMFGVLLARRLQIESIEAGGRESLPEA